MLLLRIGGSVCVKGVGGSRWGFIAAGASNQQYTFMACDKNHTIEWLYCICKGIFHLPEDSDLIWYDRHRQTEDPHLSLK